MPMGVGGEVCLPSDSESAAGSADTLPSSAVALASLVGLESLDAACASAIADNRAWQLSRLGVCEHSEELYSNQNHVGYRMEGMFRTLKAMIVGLVRMYRKLCASDLFCGER